MAPRKWQLHSDLKSDTMWHYSLQTFQRFYRIQKNKFYETKTRKEFIH